MIVANRNSYNSIIVIRVIIDTLNCNGFSQNDIQLVYNYNFKNTVKYIIRPSLSGGTCLDHTLVKFLSLKHVVSYNAHSSITDHYSVISNHNNASSSRK